MNLHFDETCRFSCLNIVVMMSELDNKSKKGRVGFTHVDVELLVLGIKFHETLKSEEIKI